MNDIKEALDKLTEYSLVNNDELSDYWTALGALYFRSRDCWSAAFTIAIQNEILDIVKYMEDNFDIVEEEVEIVVTRTKKELREKNGSI